LQEEQVIDREALVYYSFRLSVLYRRPASSSEIPVLYTKDMLVAAASSALPVLYTQDTLVVVSYHVA